MKPRNNKTSRERKWGRFLKIAGDAGTIAMSLRDKPSRLDWIAVAMRVVGLGMTIRDERRRAEAGDPWKFFSDIEGVEWTEVPEEFRRLVMEHVTDATIDDKFWDGDEHSAFICKGLIGDELVAWIGEGQNIADGPYVLTARQVETYRSLGDRLWRRIGSNHALYGMTGLVGDPFIGDGVIATAQMRDLRTRMKAFLAADVSRSYLLAGPPGTGKSMAIRWLVEDLGLSSVRIDLAVLARLHGTHSPNLATSLETLLRLLRPRAMILDDLDRVAVTAALLAFLELAQKTCKVVIASANSIDKMMGAALRPGRFDDIVRVERLDPDVLRKLIDNDGALFDRLAPLPAAYVVEYVKRQRVLGKDQAMGELDDLVKRSGQIAASADCDAD
ncbi:MAG: ATP-binding protein [Myxococcota bacterium]|nr:AAA family ATPase [Deltaproteobacteria bacterium]MDQ3339932.1 ATP-binding protein [Myxococcota bacterium]